MRTRSELPLPPLCPDLLDAAFLFLLLLLFLPLLLFLLLAAVRGVYKAVGGLRDDDGDDVVDDEEELPLRELAQGCILTKAK